jgi:hypothetical protein
MVNKYIIGDMVTEILKEGMNMVDYPLPEELRAMEGKHPTYGRVVRSCVRYKADKLKRISVIRHDVGGIFVGSDIMIVGEDEYDFPFVLVNIAFVSADGGKDKIFAEFEAKPLVKDEESTMKYIEPLRGWREQIGKLPSEPVSGFGQPGEFIEANMSPIEYRRYIPVDYLGDILDLTRQFFRIVLSYWHKAEPVKDIKRREKIDAFRREYNRHIIDDDPSGRTYIAAFGRKKALLAFENITFL